jgi:hypothetical protein
MQKRTKGCLWIALGVAIVAVMVGIALVAGAGFWVYQTVAPAATFVDQDGADQQLEAIRTRFPSRVPLIDADAPAGEPRLRPEGRPPFTGELQSLHVAAYDRTAGKLVRFSIPFWLLRLAPDGNVSFGDDALDELAGREKLTVRELEAFGPGLLIDEAKPDGDRVIVWTE